MNLVLFEPPELTAPLPPDDPRTRHVRQVLRRRVGDRFDAGLLNGPRGQAEIVADNDHGLTLNFTWGPPLPPLPPRHLIVGLPRPQTARDILRDATTLGATALEFVATERGDPGYARSTLWTSGEWRRHLLTGAAQAFDPRIPTVRWGRRLPDALADAPASGRRLALDLYEAVSPLSAGATDATPSAPLALALGAERGWGASDRAALRAAGFTLHHLGPRVLRTETAVVAALAVVAAVTPPA